MSTCDLFPLDVGREWNYRSGPIDILSRVARHEVVNGEMCARLETILNGEVLSFEHIAVRDDGVYRVAIDGNAIEPPLRFLTLPVESDAAWSVKSQVLGQTISGDFAMSKKLVRVGAEEVQAVVVESRNFQFGQSELSFTSEFVSGVGKVRQVITVKDQVTTLELPSMPRPEVAQPPDSRRKL